MSNIPTLYIYMIIFVYIVYTKPHGICRSCKYIQLICNKEYKKNNNRKNTKSYTMNTRVCSCPEC